MTEGRVSVQALADATGFIIDRTLNPEKVIGQAWLISKSRVVVPASVVSNYNEAPWALTVHFPHPNLTYSVRSVGLHPDFDRRAARNHYLQQAENVEVPNVLFENDIATLTLDPEPAEMQPQQVGELNRALSLPLDITPNDLSGVIRQRETVDILKNVLQSQRTGTLSFCDERNVPFCRLLIRQGRIAKAVYGETQNELAVCELMWRRPNGNYVMQTSSSLNWGSVPDISTPTDQLAAEATRRAGELPRIVDVLGGPTARYARAAETFDFSQVNPAQKWVAERLWTCLDGFMPIGRLSERIAADSYTILKLLWDLRNANAVQMMEGEVFHQNGTLGPPLLPAGDVDLEMWEPLNGFYLDIISGAPMWLDGTFSGMTRLQSQNSLLHTIPISTQQHGAVVIKDNRLVAVHNGPVQPKPDENAPPIRVSQMTWIGALSELGIKRLRNTAEQLIEPSEGLSFDRSSTAEIQARKTQSARARATDATFDEDDRPKIALDSDPVFLQRFSKVQILGVSVVLLMISGAMMVVTLMMASSAPKTATVKGPETVVGLSPTTTSTTTTTDSPQDIEAARAVAVANGFPKSLPEGLFYEDTRKITEPKPSFGIRNDRAHQQWVVVPWPDDTPNKRLEAFSGKLPFLNYAPAPVQRTPQSYPHTDAETGQMWLAREYEIPGKNPELGDKPTQAIVGLFGAWNPKVPGTSILVMAQPTSKEGKLDYMLASTMVTQLLAQGMQQAESDDPSSGSKTGSEDATPEQLKDYRAKLEALLQSKFKPVKDKLKKAEMKSTLRLTIDDDGLMKKMDFSAPSPKEQLNNALERAVKDSEPLPKPPHTKKGSTEVAVTANGAKVTVEEY